MNNKPITILWLLYAVCLTGCFSFGKKPVNRYYLLDYIPTPLRAKNNKPPLPFTLRIKDMDVAEAYRRQEMVYRQSAHEMRFYNYHQWAVKPEYMVTDMVFKHFRTAKLFKSTSQTLLEFKPDFTLTGQILALEEYDSKEKWYAHLSITFQLEDNIAKKQIWQKNYDVRKVVVQHEPVYVVRALSFLLEHTIDKVIEEIEAVLLQKMKARTPQKTSFQAAEPRESDFPAQRDKTELQEDNTQDERD